ncbi:transcription factor SOX-5-like [Platysternon megacephalum]|uniref:Transcription factor SOX-5-like n=1 Tax=Platysternon megacephalum TaxID=55544 RepID=A0A4D9EEG5_9SAUR|nr:transcription factor SOX-5-like [Platysternon megacephalum]
MFLLDVCTQWILIAPVYTGIMTQLCVVGKWVYTRHRNVLSPPGSYFQSSLKDNENLFTYHVNRPIKLTRVESKPHANKWGRRQHGVYTPQEREAWSEFYFSRNTLQRVTGL